MIPRRIIWFGRFFVALRALFVASVLDSLCHGRRRVNVFKWHPTSNLILSILQIIHLHMIDLHMLLWFTYFDKCTLLNTSNIDMSFQITITHMQPMLRIMYHLNSFRLSYSHRGIISCHQKTFPLSFLFMFLPSIYGGQVYEYKTRCIPWWKIIVLYFQSNPFFSDNWWR